MGKTARDCGGLSAGCRRRRGSGSPSKFVLDPATPNGPEASLLHVASVGDSTCCPDHLNPTSAPSIPPGFPTTSHTASPPQPPRPPQPHPITPQTTPAHHQAEHAPAPTPAHRTTAPSPATSVHPGAGSGRPFARSHFRVNIGGIRQSLCLPSISSTHLSVSAPSLHSR